MPSLVEYDLQFLERSWDWLQDPETRALTRTPEFTREAQQDFFRSLPHKTDYWIKGIVAGEEPVGAMGLKHITQAKAEYWGYIGNKNYWGIGIGQFMMQEAINKASSLQLKQIYLFVDHTNVRAVKLYTRMGFKLEESGDLEKYYLEI